MWNFKTLGVSSVWGVHRVHPGWGRGGRVGMFLLSAPKMNVCSWEMIIYKVTLLDLESAC